MCACERGGEIERERDIEKQESLCVCVYLGECIHTLNIAMVKISEAIQELFESYHPVWHKMQCSSTEGCLESQGLNMRSMTRF